MTAYIVARNYNIPGLSELAIHEMESLCAELDIFQMMASIEPNFDKLEMVTGVESPVHAMLREKAKTTFEADHTSLVSSEFRSHLDNANFRGLMLECVQNLNRDEITRLKRDQEATMQRVKELEAICNASVEQKMAIQENSTAARVDEDDPAVQKHYKQVAPEPEIVASEDFSSISFPSFEDPVELSEPLRDLEGIQIDVPPAEDYPDEPITEEARPALTPPPPPPPAEDVFAEKTSPERCPDIIAEAVAVTETVEEVLTDWESWNSSIWGKKKKKGKKAKIQKEAAEMMENQEAQCELALPEPVEVPCVPEQAAEDEVCAYQLSHILGGESLWKSCRPCRQFLEKVAQELPEPDLYA